MKQILPPKSRWIFALERRKYGIVSQIYEKLWLEKTKQKVKLIYNKPTLNGCYLPISNQITMSNTTKQWAWILKTKRKRWQMIQRCYSKKVNKGITWKNAILFEPQERKNHMACTYQGTHKDQEGFTKELIN